MYRLHILQGLRSISEPIRQDVIEISHRSLWQGASQGDFVVFQDGYEHQNLTRVAHFRGTSGDEVSHLVVLEPPVKVSIDIDHYPTPYTVYSGSTGAGYESFREIQERFQIEFESERPNWIGNEYEPSFESPSLRGSEDDPDDPDGDGGNGGDGDGGDGDSGGIDRTGTMLSEQYAGRDAVRDAAKDTTQATILLFGVVIAGLALFEDAIRPVDPILLFPIGVGTLLLIAALIGAAFVLTRTAAFPRPSTDTISRDHRQINETIFATGRSNETSSENARELQSLSTTYYAEIEEIRKRNILLGRLIGITVATAVIGTILVLYGALSIGLGIMLTEQWLGKGAIFGDTIFVFVLLSVIVGGLTCRALKQTTLGRVAQITRAPTEFRISDSE